ncbi:DUF3105 domain-containing protein [Cellulomonas hominis]
MSTPKNAAAERRAKLAQIQAAQRHKQRTRTLLVSSIAGVLVLGLVAVTAVVLVGENRKNAAEDAAASADIPGVETFAGLTANHLTSPVDYAQDPPAGGDHAAAWQNCGVYTEPVQDENAVHSLEHGAVWITYDPALPADQVQVLDDLAAANSYLLVSPYPGLSSPVVASSWGYQLRLDDASDDRLATFVRKYLLNPELPEVGAACTNGVGTPA